MCRVGMGKWLFFVLQLFRFQDNRSRFFKVQGLGLRLERKPSEV